MFCVRVGMCIDVCVCANYVSGVNIVSISPKCMIMYARQVAKDVYSKLHHGMPTI